MSNFRLDKDNYEKLKDLQDKEGHVKNKTRWESLEVLINEILRKALKY